MLLVALALVTAVPQGCRAYDARLPRPLSGWTRNGRGLDTRHSATFAVTRGKVETRITIRKAGLVGIAADQDGWIDAFAGRGGAMKMARESRGPRCSTIRKIVYYRMRPGTYRVTVNRLKGNRVKLMLTHD